MCKVVIRNGKGEPQKFRMSFHDEMSKIFHAYAARLGGGVTAGDFRFDFDGDTVSPETTPEDADMDPEDVGENLMDCFPR